MSQQRHLWIAIPAYTGQIHLGTMRSLMTDMLKLAERGDKVTIFDECGNALIGDCRAVIVAKFLAGDGTDLLFLDSDVVWEAGKALRLLDAPVDCRVGIYPQRRDPLNFCVRWKQDREFLVADSETSLLEIDGAPAGFMMLSRAMLERMTAHYRELDFWCDDAPDRRACGLFESYWYRDAPLPTGERGNVKLGEDYAFCQRWLDIGGQVWVDPEIRMGHVGYKTFMGSLGEWLREAPDFSERAVAHANRMLDEMENEPA